MLNTSPSQDGPFPYSTSVRLNNRTKPRVGWIFSYICCIFVHPDLNSAPLFVEMQERSTTDSQGTNAIWDKLYSFQLALTNRAGGLYVRILTKVVIPDQTQRGTRSVHKTEVKILPYRLTKLIIWQRRTI